VLCTKAISGYNDPNNINIPDSDEDNEEDEDDSDEDRPARKPKKVKDQQSEEEMVNNLKVLPMFACLEQMKVQLCIDLSFTKEQVPEYLRHSVYKLTNQEL
jgi:hypothetical protein